MTALPAPVSGERTDLQTPAGRVSVFTAGQGAPVLLVHSVNAAASTAEVAPVHEHLRATRTVHSLDLPGFGFSDRSDRAYTPRMMTDAVIAVAEHASRRAGGAKVDALALSLGTEFLTRAAAERPELFSRLALVSPTGFQGGRSLRGAPGSTRQVPGMMALLRGPGWGGPLFRALTRPGVVRFFLRGAFGSKVIDETLWQHAVATARVPGAEFAPLHFLSGGLFSADLHDLQDRLQMPVWVAHGVSGDFTDYRGLQRVRGRAHWRITEMATGALPWFEQREAFLAEFDRYLAMAPAL